MKFYSADELRKAVDLDYLIRALEAGHKKGKPETADSLIGPSRGRYLVRSAHDGESLLGSKLITIFPDNPARRSLVSVRAIIVLFDAEDGQLKAALDATELTYWKTACDSALGASILARQDAGTLAILGAGGLAPWLVRAHLRVRPGISRVVAWNRTRANGEALAELLAGEGIDITLVADPETAVRGADIVTTATMTSEPVLLGQWLKAGAHVDLVGSYSPDTRESDNETISRGRLFVDSRESALDGVGDVLAPIEEGVITEQDIQGDLFDLAAGKTGRKSDDEITVFKNAGGAHLDLMIADALLQRLNGA